MIRGARHTRTNVGWKKVSLVKEAGKKLYCLYVTVIESYIELNFCSSILL